MLTVLLPVWDGCCCIDRYEASELERAQLREAVLKHKAEMEVLATEHMEEISSMAAMHETEMALALKHRAEMERQLEDANNRLGQAQVGLLLQLVDVSMNGKRGTYSAYGQCNESGEVHAASSSSQSGSS